jgi:nitrile hydratase subunit alpha
MTHDEHGDEHHDHDRDHDHGHSHDHGPFQPDLKEPTEDWEFLEIALRELLIDKGVITAREVQDKIEEWDGKVPENGAKVVARAWVDPAFQEAPAGRRQQGCRRAGIRVSGAEAGRSGEYAEGA